MQTKVQYSMDDTAGFVRSTLLLVVREGKGRSEHGLVAQLGSDDVVNMQQKAGETGGEVGEESAGEVSKIFANILRQILVVMFLVQASAVPRVVVSAYLVAEDTQEVADRLAVVLAILAQIVEQRSVDGL